MAQLGRAPGWLRQEIERVKAALARYNKERDEIADEWARGGYPCCPACYSRR